MITALAFLTVFGRARMPTRGALLWFPAVGAGVGVTVGLVWHEAGRIWSPIVAAVLAVTVDAIITGALHYDGLADSGDGLLAPMPRQRRLDVMRDPRTGAFGVVAVVLTVIARVAGFAAAASSVVAVAVLWCLSRAAAAVTVATVTYARDGGLAAAFRSGPGRHRGRVAAAVGVGAAGIVAVLLPFTSSVTPLLVAAAVELAAFTGVVAFAARRLGGFTGDVLGAAILTGETCALLTLAARW